jgi:hypothetical protein
VVVLLPLATGMFAVAVLVATAVFDVVVLVVVVSVVAHPAASAASAALATSAASLFLFIMSPKVVCI